MKKQWFIYFATVLAVVCNFSTAIATPLGEAITRQYTGVVTGEVYPAGSQLFNENWLEIGDAFSFDLFTRMSEEAVAIFINLRLRFILTVSCIGMNEDQRPFILNN